MTNWQSFTIAELVKSEIIEPPMDGNHGETHPKGNDFIETGIPFIMASDINDSVIDLQNCKFITKEQADNLRKGFAQEGDVLLTHKASLGRTAIVPKNTFSYLMLTPQVTYYRIKRPDVLNNIFLKYYFDFKPFQQTLKLWGGAGSTRAYLGITGQRNLSVRIPDSVTQIKISSFLHNIDKKIELNNRINTELEAMAKTLYDYWFVQFDFPNPSTSSGKFGKPYKSSGGKMVFNEVLKREIPEGWEVDDINDIVEVKDGTHDSPKPKEIGCHLITSKNLKKEGLDFENANLISEEDYKNINKRSEVETGDILFSMIGSIGIVYKVDEKDINFAIKNVALYKSSKKPDYMNYLYTTLNSHYMKQYMGNVISGSIQKFIGLGSLRKMPILNNQAVIDRFEKKTEYLFQEISLKKEENQQLTQLRDWLLPMLMNGQVTVK